MDPLPKSTSSTSSPHPVIQGGSSLAKEVEVGRSTPAETPVIVEVGQEKPLPPEVTQIGVSLHPTSVSIPKTVAQLGVKPVGQASSVALAPAVVLPLSDEQIAQGLHQSITSSWRWLAAWCVRRLKEMHLAIRRVGGKTIRERV